MICFRIHLNRENGAYKYGVCFFCESGIVRAFPDVKMSQQMVLEAVLDPPEGVQTFGWKMFGFAEDVYAIKPVQRHPGWNPLQEEGMAYPTPTLFEANTARMLTDTLQMSSRDFKDRKVLARLFQKGLPLADLESLGTVHEM